MRARTHIINLLYVCLAFLFVSAESFAQRSTHSRLFPSSGTYPANITIAPNGSVLSRSGDSPNLLIFDGYTRREVTMASENTYRVYQSRAGQLWTVARDGLHLFHGNEWSYHPIPEIRTEFANNPIRQLRQISLLPAEVNHVLILLSDRLLDYDATTRQTRILKDVRSTRLGEFTDIQEGIDESVWVSGMFGLAHVQGPTRRITPQTQWGEFILPDTNLVNSLQKPLEHPSGHVTTVALSLASQNPRFAVSLANDIYTWRLIPGEKIKQAWTGWDGVLWGYSTPSLFRIDDGNPVRLQKESVSGAQYDMAMETNGVFWIASSEGLTRYAPYLWRSRPDFEDLQSAVHSIVFDVGRNTTWCAGPEGLIAQQGPIRKVFPWPESIENLIPPRESLFLIGRDRVLIAAERSPVLFNPSAGTFTPLPIPEGTQVHILGQLQDGRPCAWFEKPGEDLPVDLRAFNGEVFEPIKLPAFSAKGAELLLIRENARSDLWIATSTGIILVRPGPGTVEYFGPEQGLPTERITTLAEAGEGRIWCGTGSRAFEFNGQRWEHRLNTTERINSIIPALGSIWVGTAAGVYRLLQDSWILHGEGEGIPVGGVFTLKISPANQLWAGSSRGLVAFHPDADLDPPRTLTPVVQEPQTPSTIEPTVISFRGQDRWNYTAARDLFFSHRLDEGTWTPFSNVTSRVFQNLSSGTHILEVRAMDRNGNQAPSPSRIEFSVIVPWFQDPRLLVVTILAGCVTLVLAGYALNKHFQLKRSYAEVEQIVAQRTRELERANQELLHSQKMRAIGTMAAGIAHDFNNILSIIKGSAQIIEGNVEDKDKIKTRVNRIQTVVEQGTSIVKALLGLGRATENELAPCDIPDLLHQTRKLLSDRFTEEVQMQIDVSETLPSVVCSEDVLQQILLNFILNAVEAMGNRGMVELSARESTNLPHDLVLEPAGANSYVVISVTDQGGGIPPQILPRIFEPFFTTKSFSSRRGTGLGLSMAYELAKGLGYGLSVDTRVGHGSRFSIFLPVSSPAEKRSPGRSARDESPAPVKSQINNP